MGWTSAAPPDLIAGAGSKEVWSPREVWCGRGLQECAAGSRGKEGGRERGAGGMNNMT